MPAHLTRARGWLSSSGEDNIAPHTALPLPCDNVGREYHLSHAALPLA